MNSKILGTHQNLSNGYSVTTNKALKHTYNLQVDTTNPIGGLYNNRLYFLKTLTYKF